MVISKNDHKMWKSIKTHHGIKMCSQDITTVSIITVAQENEVYDHSCQGKTHWYLFIFPRFWQVDFMVSDIIEHRNFEINENMAVYVKGTNA